ncbi:MAG: GNAT family N-acetyltransferase [Caulobacteraceae bacterium]
MTVTLGPILETERLILRPPETADLEPWMAFSADAEAMRFIGGVQARSVAWRSVCAAAGAWTIRGFSWFSVIEKASGRWIGRLGPWQPEGWPGTEVGWGIVRDAWGQGYAREGAAAAMDYVFDTLGWSEAIHTIDPENVASQALARRLGSTLKGPAKIPPPYEHLAAELWSQTREEWKANRGRP